MRTARQHNIIAHLPRLSLRTSIAMNIVIYLSSWGLLARLVAAAAGDDLARLSAEILTAAQLEIIARLQWPLALWLRG
jgi:hypothetical protein